MKSFKNHISLVVALLSILFSIQVFVIVDRSVEAYKTNLANNYSVIIVSEKRLEFMNVKSLNKLINSMKMLSADSVIKRLNTGLSDQNIELLKLTLPKFYKIHLSSYPTPTQIQMLKADLMGHPTITKVEDFSSTHDKTYKLLLLFRNVVSLFAIVVLIVTTLLIFKELRIWQFKHNERMNIMGLFGSAVWLRSAILFRLAIVDAIISSILVFGLFYYASSSPFIHKYFTSVGISVTIFDFVNDSLILFGVSLSLSIILASLIAIGHKEEV